MFQSHPGLLLALSIFMTHLEQCIGQNFLFMRLAHVCRTWPC